MNAMTKKIMNKKDTTVEFTMPEWILAKKNLRFDYEDRVTMDYTLCFDDKVDEARVIQIAKDMIIEKSMITNGRFLQYKNNSDAQTLTYSDFNGKRVAYFKYYTLEYASKERVNKVYYYDLEITEPKI